MPFLTCVHLSTHLYLLSLAAAVKKSWLTLENEEGYKKCQEVVVEAKERVDESVSCSGLSYFSMTTFCLQPIHVLAFNQMKQKRKQLKKEGKPTTIPEDDEENVSAHSLADLHHEFDLQRCILSLDVCFFFSVSTCSLRTNLQNIC